MRILFAKDGSEAGAKELKELTGSYYANNDFSRIKQTIKLETETLVELIGAEVYQLAEDFYYANNSGENSDNSDQNSGNSQNSNSVELLELLEHIQLPIALLSVIKFYSENLVSHEGAGRKTKVDKNNEVLPWEWMIDKDDQAHERKAYAAIDRLIRFLDKSELPEWQNSDAQKASRDLFVNTTKIFDAVYPIDKSGRFYYSVVPFLAEIQRTKIAKALGAVKYAQVLAWHKHPGTDTQTESALENSIIITFIQQAMPLLAMEIAVKRFALNVLPFSVVQQFRSMNQNGSASQVALDATIDRFAGRLKKSAVLALNELQLYLNSNDPEASVYDLLPENPPNQKFFRT